MDLTSSSTTFLPDTSVISGAVLSGQTIDDGLSTIVQSGGLVEACVFGSGSIEDLLGGMDSGSVFESGTSQIVMSGGIALDDVIMGSQTVLAGGRSISAHVSSGGSVGVGFGAIATDTDLASGAIMRVAGTGSATDVTVGAGAVLTLASGGGGVGTLTGGAVESGGEVLVGGVDSGTTLESGAFMLVSGGMVSDDVVESGALLVLYDGATASGTVSAGGQVVSTGVVTISGTTGTYDGNVYSGASIRAADILVIEGGLFESGLPEFGNTGCLFRRRCAGRRDQLSRHGDHLLRWRCERTDALRGGNRAFRRCGFRKPGHLRPSDH